MRKLIIARIQELFERESGTRRWHRLWLNKNLELTDFNKKDNTLVNITKIDWETVPDDKLVFLFERIVFQAYKQLG